MLYDSTVKSARVMARSATRGKKEKLNTVYHDRYCVIFVTLFFSLVLSKRRPLSRYNSALSALIAQKKER